MDSKSGLQIEFHAKGHVNDDQAVDAWELKAARRALMNLKTLLYGQPMLDLIQKQIEASDAYYKEIIAASDGKYRECRVDLHVKGLTATQIQNFRKRHMTQAADKQKARDAMALGLMLPAHPEHYALPPDYQEGIIEVIGEHMARIRVEVTSDVPSFVMDYGHPDYPIKKPTIGQLDDGTVLFHILHEFRDREHGCDCILRLLFPVAAPQVFFDDHAEHLSIEFRSFLRAAFNDHNEFNGSFEASK